MNIQYYDGKIISWLEPKQKYEIETGFLMEAWKKAQKSNSEKFLNGHCHIIKKNSIYKKLSFFWELMDLKKYVVMIY